MIGRTFQTVERLAKCQVTNDIKRGVVVPSDHVDGFLAVSARFIYTFEQQIDILLDSSLLFHHGLGRESMGHRSAIPLVVFSIRTNNVASVRGVSKRILLVLWLATFAMTLEIVRCARLTDGKDFWRYADERTIGFVKLEQRLMGLTAKLIAGIGNTRCGPQLGTRKPPQRMEEEIVGSQTRNIKHPLVNVIN